MGNLFYLFYLLILEESSKLNLPMPSPFAPFSFP